MAMKDDGIKWANQAPVDRIISKETLNHRGLIEMVSGLDVYQNTSEAFIRAYEALGIDIINRVPQANAPQPTPDGQFRPHKTRPYNYSSLGVYDTVLRHSYPCKTVECVWQLNVDDLLYEDLITPVPHPCKRQDIQAREAALGETGLYYPMLYTTLFMWAVEVLGMEVFSWLSLWNRSVSMNIFCCPASPNQKRLLRKWPRLPTVRFFLFTMILPVPPARCVIPNGTRIIYSHIIRRYGARQSAWVKR